MIFVGGLLVGGVIGSAGSSDSGSQATATSIVFRDREVPARPLPTSMPTAGQAGQTTTTAKPKPTTPPPATIDEGTWAVPSEVKPGTYVSAGGESCYWARLRNTSGSLDSIIANSINPGRQRVTVRSTDKAFETTGCPTWRKVS